jgi:tetratricopeptide (TPR) repeat protein
VRCQAAIVLNLFLPGTGLILARREWLGVTLAALFGVLVQLGLWGCLIEPARVPAWLAAACLAGGALVWLAAQYQLRQRLVQMRDPGVQEELARLRDQAAGHVANGGYKEAWAVLQVALAIDDEDLDSNVQTAELLAALGRVGEARKAWRRVAQLDRGGVYSGRTLEALDRLRGR